jgi:LysR family glycine cleavage system transcriptional activator
LAYYLVHRKESGQHAPVQAFKEWLLEEVGSG